MNHIFISGNLTHDPTVHAVLRKTHDGTVVGGGKVRVMVLRVATDRYMFKDKVTGKWIKETQYHRVVCYDRFTRSFSFLRKGDPITVVGVLVYRRFDRKDGGWHRIAEIRAQQLHYPRGGSKKRDRASLFVEPTETPQSREALFKKLDGI